MRKLIIVFCLVSTSYSDASSKLCGPKLDTTSSAVDHAAQTLITENNYLELDIAIAAALVKNYPGTRSASEIPSILVSQVRRVSELSSKLSALRTKFEIPDYDLFVRLLVSHRISLEDTKARTMYAHFLATTHERDSSGKYMPKWSTKGLVIALLVETNQLTARQASSFIGNVVAWYETFNVEKYVKPVEIQKVIDPALVDKLRTLEERSKVLVNRITSATDNAILNRIFASEQQSLTAGMPFFDMVDRATLVDKPRRLYVNTDAGGTPNVIQLFNGPVHVIDIAKSTRAQIEAQPLISRALAKQMSVVNPDLQFRNEVADKLETLRRHGNPASILYLENQGGTHRMVVLLNKEQKPIGLIEITPTPTHDNESNFNENTRIVAYVISK